VINRCWHFAFASPWPPSVWAQLLAATVEHQRTGDGDALYTSLLLTVIPSLDPLIAQCLPVEQAKALLMELGLNF
jgi:hypothetical protein